MFSLAPTEPLPSRFWPVEPDRAAKQAATGYPVVVRVFPSRRLRRLVFLGIPVKAINRKPNNARTPSIERPGTNRPYAEPPEPHGLILPTDSTGIDICPRLRHRPTAPRVSHKPPAGRFFLGRSADRSAGSISHNITEGMES